MPSLYLTRKINSFFTHFNQKIKVTVTLVGERKVLFLFSVLFGFCLGLSPLVANAQTPTSLGIGVSPHTFELDLFPGEIRSEKIKISNKSNVPLPIAVRVTDFTAAENLGDMLFDEASEDPSIASRKWFKIENPNFILEADETERVNFKIEVPENAEPGGHFSVMLFEPQLPSFYFREGQPRTIPVVGVLFLISIKTFTLEPEVQQKLDVVEFSLPKEERIVILENLISKLIASSGELFSAKAQAATEITITKKSPQNFILRIKNNDIYHLKPYGKILIYNIFGKKVGEREVAQRTILPGKVRQFPVSFSPEVSKNLKWLPASISNFFSKNTSLGKYRVVLEIGEEKSQIELNQSLDFWAFPWKIILPGFIILIFLILIRKRALAAIKILVGRKTP